MFGLTRERNRQIEKRALKILRESVPTQGIREYMERAS